MKIKIQKKKTAGSRKLRKDPKPYVSKYKMFYKPLNCYGCILTSLKHLYEYYASLFLKFYRPTSSNCVLDIIYIKVTFYRCLKMAHYM